MNRETLRGQYAGFISRLIAFGIDIAVITVSILALTWLLSATASLFSIDRFARMDVALKITILSIATLFYTAVYYIFFWTLAGQTPGKTLMGLRITTLEGQPLSFGRSLRRFIGYIVSILAFWLGFLWILLDNRRQGWHDKIAGTFVIYSWDARADSYLTEKIRQKQESHPQP
jgi:uncharacterized RDD family membrane protein YckC